MPASGDASRIYIWRVGLNASPGLEAQLAETLSHAERARSRAFATPDLSRRFTVSHGILRMLLSHYVGIPAREVEFGYGPAGKPSVQNARAPIEFNMSHSGDLAAYAFGAGSALGIDVERLRPIADLAGVADLFFSRQEQRDLQSCNEPERTAAFLKIWTCKEAYLKAVGRGLSDALDRVEIRLRPAEPPVFGSLPPGDAYDDWQIRDITQADHVGALVFRGAQEVVEMPPLDAVMFLNGYPG